MTGKQDAYQERLALQPNLYSEPLALGIEGEEKSHLQGRRTTEDAAERASRWLGQEIQESHGGRVASLPS